MLDVGLNPYGLTYYLGLQGRGTPRANPDGRGLEGFIELAEELGAQDAGDRRDVAGAAERRRASRRCATGSARSA